MGRRLFTRRLASAMLVAAALLLLPLRMAHARELRTIGTLWVPEFDAIRGLPRVSFSELSETGPRGGAWLQPLRLVKRLDAGSPLLLETMTSGRRLQTVQVRLHAVGSQPQIDWTLTDVVLVGHEIAPGKSDPAIYETVSLRPARMRMDVTTESGTIGTCWDWAQRKPC
ncbi:MAG: type VI secretion system tube protein Hcp [Alphaproteobacteria bacterium]